MAKIERRHMDLALSFWEGNGHVGDRKVAQAIADLEERVRQECLEKASKICEQHASGYVDTAAVHLELRDTARDIREEADHG